MEYFCYISRSKVDQLFNNYFPNEQSEWNETKSKTNEVNVDLSTDWSIAKIINLFKSGITYGRKGVIQREGKIKIQYTEKLKKVLIAMTKERAIPELKNVLSDKEGNPFIVSYEGEFNIENPIESASSNRVVTVCSKYKDLNIKLDCSLRFFSEGNEPNEMFLIHSGNRRFFSGELPIYVSTIFLFLGKKEFTIYGTPLFLLLKSNDEFNQL